MQKTNTAGNEQLDKVSEKPLSAQAEIISKLQAEAKAQARLEQSRVLPRQAGAAAHLISRYPWQSLLLASLATTLLIELVFAF